MKFSIKDFSSAATAQYNDHVPSVNVNTVLNTHILELENFTFSALKTAHIE